MSAHFNVDSEMRLVTVRFGNEVTVQDVVQYLESLKTSLAFEPDFSELVDLTQVMSSEVDFQAAMMLAHEVDPFSREARRAFVAPGPQPSGQYACTRWHVVTTAVSLFFVPWPRPSTSAFAKPNGNSRATRAPRRHSCQAKSLVQAWSHRRVPRCSPQSPVLSQAG